MVFHILRGCALWILCAGLPLSTALAAPPPNPRAEERPRIAVVLSGGGARGAAHVGVLEVLEQLQIPVDIIAGTSMGAVIGGLYASGIEIHALDNLLADLPWDDLFQDKTRRRDLAFRRKEDDYNYISNFNFGFKGGSLQIPTGLIQGQRLELTLGLLTLPVATIRNFDNLTFPFRAVATNITDGEAVVLGHGDLADAIRASMAIPGAFAPVEIDNQLLVDGGSAMNLPVQVAQEMGADIVIAVDISTPLRKREQLNNALSITGQTTTLLIQNNTRDQIERLGSEDFLIQPDLGPVATMSFDQLLEAANRGTMAALALRKELSALSLDDEAWSAYRASLERPSPVPPVISDIRIVNQSVVSDDVIRSRIHVDLGEALDFAVLARDIDILYGLDVFDHVNFRIDRLPDGRNQLVILTREKATGRNRVRLGFELETDFVSNSLFNIGVNVTRVPMNSMVAEWRTELQIGQYPAIKTEFWQPLDDETRWFVAPELFFQSLTFGQFDNQGNELAEYRTFDVGGGLGFGRQLGQWGEVRAGISYDWATADLFVGDPSLVPKIQRSDGQVFLRFVADTLDNARFPTEGGLLVARAALGFKALGSTNDYQSLFATAEYAKTWGKNTLVGDIQTGVSFENEITVNNLYTLGGFLRLSGLRPNELVGSDMLFFRLRGYRRVAKLGLLSFTIPAYVGFSIEGGNTWLSTSDISPGSMLWGGSVYFALDTPIAPFYIAYGNTNGDRQAAYFYLGQVF
ncbi:MAG: patatin-like phospholipase family protein [Myxococcota bacterium]|nr:patatin-like phospholipase family protein [Myxococcota bacterium]